jgi:hypothetical protein
LQIGDRDRHLRQQRFEIVAAEHDEERRHVRFEVRARRVRGGVGAEHDADRFGIRARRARA